MFKASNSLTAVTLFASLALPFSASTPAMAQHFESSSQVFEMEAPTLPVVAEIVLDNGKISFIDETIDGVFGLGILEVGKVNLARFYERGATPLEIFLALAPPASKIPEQLYRAHEEARRHDPSIPAEPRMVFQKSVTGYPFSQDTNECWQWGGGDSSDFAGAYGYPPYSDILAYDNFITWSQIPDALGTSSAAYVDEDTIPVYEMSYSTPFGHERAVAMCVTHAETPDQYSTCPSGNTVNYRVRLKGEDASSSWYSAWEYLTAYGEGVRYRSSSTGSKKYTLEVFDLSVKSIHCQEKFDVYLRSRNVRIY